MSEACCVFLARVWQLTIVEFGEALKGNFKLKGVRECTWVVQHIHIDNVHASHCIVYMLCGYKYDA